MNRYSQLLTLSNELDKAFLNWRTHPDDSACQKQYETAKSRMDNEIKHCKEEIDIRHSH